MSSRNRTLPTRTITGRCGYVRRSWGPGWALVGGAGYYEDPLIAHGLTDALRDAELLARAITAVVIEGADEADAGVWSPLRFTGKGLVHEKVTAR